MQLTLKCSLVSCVRTHGFHLGLPGPKIIFGRWLDTMTSKRNYFLLGQVLFPDQSKSWGKNELILMLSSISKCDCIFAKKQSLRFTGEDLAVCSRKTGQHDWRVEPLIWPVKTPFWLNIVCWTAVIFSPGCNEPFNFCYPSYATKVLQQLNRQIFNLHVITACLITQSINMKPGPVLINIYFPVL